MAGAFTLAPIRRATVRVSPPAGEPYVVTNAQVWVRDGVAYMRSGGAKITMAAASVERLARLHAVIRGADGTEWDAEKDCGCGGRR